VIILITGANGFIGNHLVYSLKNDGHQVIACTHNTNNYKINDPLVKVIKCDFRLNITPDSWLEKLQHVDVVINTVGIIKETPTQKFKILHQDAPIALFKACELIGIKKIITISALGADASAFSQFHISKKIADDYLKTLNLNWVIIMPSIVYGSGAKSLTLFKTMAALPITPLIENGNQVVQPIHINDFCIAVNLLVKSDQPNRVKIAFIGSEPITMKNIFILLKLWLGIDSCRFIQVPYSIMLIFSKIGKLLPQNPVSTESLKMLMQGNTADVTPFINYFGFKPLNLSESLNIVPVQQADRWHIKLLILQPLLKVSIAFVWIFTGITTIFIYPIESSYNLLEQIGIKDQLAPITLFTAATMDFILGLTLLVNYRIKIIGLLQIATILCYTVLISLFLPEQWLHPFGAISKNIPLIIAIAILIVLHDKNWR